MYIVNKKPWEEKSIFERKNYLDAWAQLAGAPAKNVQSKKKSSIPSNRTYAARTAGVPTERQMGKMIVVYCGKKNIPIQHTPNEGRRTMNEGYALKQQGLIKGWPDYFIPLMRGGFGGLFIELKRDVHCKLTVEQKAWLSNLTQAGYYAIACYGQDDAIRVIDGYMSLPAHTAKYSIAP